MEFTVSQSQGCMEGRRIVDLQELAKQMNCKSCKGLLDLNHTVNEALYGFASVLYIKCLCGDMNEVHTGKKQQVDGNHMEYEINTKASINLMLYGSAVQNIFNFLQAVLDIPVIANDNSFSFAVVPSISTSSVTGLPVPVGMHVNYSTAVQVGSQIPTQLLQVPQHPVQFQMNTPQQPHEIHPFSSKPQQQVLIIPQHKVDKPATQSQQIVHPDSALGLEPARLMSCSAQCTLCPTCPHRVAITLPGSSSCSTLANESGSTNRNSSSLSVNPAGDSVEKVQGSSKKNKPLAPKPKIKLTKDERDDLKVNTKCLVCKIVFRSREHFRMHRILHPQIVKKKKKVKCSVCSSEFTDQRKFQRHIANHTDSQHKCGLCGKICFTKAILTQHMNRIHYSKEQTKEAVREQETDRTVTEAFHKCSKCDKLCKTKASLNAHMRIHCTEKVSPNKHVTAKPTKKDRPELNLIRPSHTVDPVISSTSNLHSHLTVATHVLGPTHDTLATAVPVFQGSLFYQ